MFGYLRRLFSSKHDDEAHDDESEIEYVTWDDALAIARKESIRGFEVRGDAVEYVAFVAGLEDYCFCRFVHESNGWVLTVRSLQQHERLPEETIDDNRIVETARRGSKLIAVRLYRTKYNVGLKEAVDGVESLVRGTE